MKTAFLLGAGASKDAGLPLAADVTELVLGDKFRILTAFQNPPYQPHNLKGPRQSVNQTILPFLLWMKEQVRSAQNRTVNYEDLAYMAIQFFDHLVGEFENPAIHPLIEKVPRALRFLQQAATGKSTDQLERLSDETLNFIRKVVSLAVVSCPRDLHYLRFLIEAPDGPGSSIFTLNNDTLVEQLLLREGKDFSDGFEPSIPAMNFMDGIDVELPAMGRWNPASLEQESGPDTIRLFKLHGSVNWFRYRPIAKNSRDEFSRIGVDKAALQKFMKLPPANRPDHDLPILLIGTFNKMLRYTSAFFLPLHSAFCRELDRTDRLIVCGYSFGDKGINQHIVNWLNGKRHRRMAIVNACDEKALWKAARGAISGRKDEWKRNKQLVLFLKSKLRCVGWEEVWCGVR